MVSIITPFEIALDAALYASLSAMATLLLITLMVLKELALASEKREWQAFGRFLNIAIAPLLIIFLITVVIRVVDVLKELGSS
jgi:hypothetical protein